MLSHRQSPTFGKTSVHSRRILIIGFKEVMCIFNN